MPRSLKLTVGDRTLWLVPARDLVRWNEDHARWHLRDAMQSWPSRAALVRLAAELGEPDAEPERALAWIVRCIDRGAIVVARLDDGWTGFDEAQRGEDDWLPPDTPTLSELLPPELRPRREPPAPRDLPAMPAAVDPNAVPEPPQVHFAAFEVTDVDGAALRGTWTCTIGGDARHGALGAGAERFEPLPAGITVDLQFRPLGLLAPSRAAFVPTDEATARAAGQHVVDFASELGPISLSLDCTTRIVVRVPKATVFTLPAYDLDLEVFRPGWLWFDDESLHGISGIGCVAQALAYARAHPERRILVVGHTDTSGSKTHNRGVAERRAAHLSALLRADVKAWVASCETDGTVADLCAHVRWAAGRFAWACDPGVASAMGPQVRTALAAWRGAASEATGIHVDPEAEPCADDWRIAYALLDLALAEELDLDLAALAQLRGGLQWCDPPVIGAGELWPRALVGRNGVASALNRRTEILFATVDAVPGGAGDPAGRTIYGDQASLWLDYVDPEPRAALPLSLVSTDGHVVGETPFKLVGEGGRVRYGRLGPGPETLVEDVAAGGFRVFWLDPDDVALKIWASRCEAALAARDVAMLEHALDRPPAWVQALSQAWSDRFGDGAADGLARAVRTLVVGHARELPIDYLLAQAGFPGDVEYELAAAAQEEPR
jgi:hypothetical protein